MDPQYSLTTARREFGEFGGVNASVEASTTFTVLHARTLPQIFSGAASTKGCYVYARSYSPNVIALSRSLAALEGTEAAYAMASGMSAISSAILAICSAGDEIVASNSVYGGTHALLSTFLPLKCNIKTHFVDISNLAEVAAAMTSKTKILYTEAISNPTLVVADLPSLATLAHGRGAQLVVDNTFSPMILSPAHWGADVVVHSMTKFMSGASDMVAGAVCGSRAFIDSLMDFHTGSVMLLGGTMDPKVASELALRLPHLALRMTEHSRRALYLAQQLEQLGAKVTYPGLPSHPGHELLRKLANKGYGFGGLLGLEVGTSERAELFMERLQNKHGFGFLAVSLGYFDTLMSQSAASTSSELTAEERLATGISDGYIRMSIGITGTLDQRWEQMKEAYLFLDRYSAKAPAARFRATRSRREADGSLTRVTSWLSLNSCEEASGDMESDAEVFSHPAVSDAEGEVASAVVAGSKRAAEGQAVAGPAAKFSRTGEEISYRRLVVEESEEAKA